MGDLRIRNFDDHAKIMLRDRAKREGTTLELLAKAILEQEAFRKRRELVEEMHRNLEEMRQKYGVMEDSTPGIRAERDERG